jgi:hypothetical protein
MCTRAASLLLLALLILGCGPGGEAASRDTATTPDTAAIRGAGGAPHPPPTIAESAAARAPGDSALRPRRP